MGGLSVGGGFGCVILAGAGKEKAAAAVTEPTLTRADFPGHWSLSRRIDDRLTGQSGVFAGMARFLPHGNDAAIHDESGLLRRGDATPLTAERWYLWRCAADEVVVRYADGRDFFGFRPAVRGSEIVHVCDAGTTRVIHDFTGWPRWQAIWPVTGPRKDDRLRSAWRRV